MSPGQHEKVPRKKKLILFRLELKDYDRTQDFLKQYRKTLKWSVKSC